MSGRIAPLKDGLGTSLFAGSDRNLEHAGEGILPRRAQCNPVAAPFAQAKSQALK
jgi:hypothetical protein